ncbi:ATP-grasp domain-containing protein [Nakamurella silvestris]|nr:ATP-grasp domain-containing protein [Nakamurella silvestris]
MTSQNATAPADAGPPFERVLIANRGEIAVRIIRTLRDLGVGSIAIHSDADAGARHVREADVAVRLGSGGSPTGYLDIEAVIAAAKATGAQAIHPGYGFLSENADFARACAAAGIVFIGPPVHAVDTMGDKIRAKTAVRAAGVPVVPGRVEPGMSDADLADAAAEIGFPVLIKPSAGGGGKGMHLVTDPADLAETLAGARREAAAAFGDATLFIERFVTRPRHVEVQVLADSHGTTVHLGERECSLQRRHQKVVEEAPSALLDAATRERIGAAAVATARSVGYTGAGTVEFIVSADAPGEFFFMEMNTRLQVEHPVTEMVTGIDLVACQLQVAAGRPLGFGQSDVTLTGHAVEARVYAEQPANGFLPATGTATRLTEPAGDGIRVDSSLDEGSVIGTSYDPMLAKVIAWAPDRATALARLDHALAGTTILGVDTNISFLRKLLVHPEVRIGALDTDLIDRELPRLLDGPAPTWLYGAWAAVRLRELQGGNGSPGDPWSRPSGWRALGSAETRWRVDGGGSEPITAAFRVITWTATGFTATVTVDSDGPVFVAGTFDGSELVLTADGLAHRLSVAVIGEVTWFGLAGRTFQIRQAAPVRAGDRSVARGGQIRSPMPGTVIAVLAAAGEEVLPGRSIAVVEAMKMEHTLRAEIAGSIEEVLVRVGDQVAVDQLLASILPEAP